MLLTVQENLKKFSWCQECVGLLIFALLPICVYAQPREFMPITTDVLENPDPEDWLMLSRTYDQQRFSPLDQIDQGNVKGLRMVWSRGLSAGTQQTIPIVYDGVMYSVAPGASVLALDATNGDLIWEYKRETDRRVRATTINSTSSKSLAIYQDMIFYTSPDGYLVALDARDGTVRWETLPNEPGSGASNSSAPIIVQGNVISGQACSDYASCFVSAHDALTGKLIWKFHTSAAEGEPGGDSWGSVPTEKRVSSVWGLPGSYDPVRGLIYWGTANPRPYTRLSRHGSADGTSRTAPADLYTNSTISLESDSGKLAWYYQHLPGDDWDADHAHERVLLSTAINPDIRYVKWINPRIRKGEQRDVMVHIGEGGGLWVLDRITGEFLWATPFPEDVPQFNISNIDVESGRTEINFDNVFKQDQDTVITCFHNTRGYWPMAYHPDTNSIYVAYHDYCLSMTADLSNPSGFRDRVSVVRPGVDPDTAYGLAKVNMGTGKMEKIYTSSVPGNGAVLATAGGLIFWGDMNRRFRAFDARDGKVLWESILGGIIQMSTITYAVDGKQYIAVMTGDGGSATRNPIDLANIEVPRGHNEIYVFALPD